VNDTLNLQISHLNLQFSFAHQTIRPRKNATEQNDSK
jgi:hypothetical protein